MVLKHMSGKLFKLLDLWFSGISWGYKMGTLDRNGLIGVLF